MTASYHQYLVLAIPADHKHSQFYPMYSKPKLVKVWETDPEVEIV